VIPAADLRVDRARSGGPGGQHVNTTSSKVRIVLDLAGTAAFSDVQKAWLREKIPPRFLAGDGAEVFVVADEERSQHMNLAAARERLAALLRASLVRPKRRVATKPGKAAKARRLEGKSAQSRKKEGRGRVRDD
jgi:ribosome-associated protein